MSMMVAKICLVCVTLAAISCHESTYVSRPSASPESRLLLGKPAPFAGPKVPPLEAEILRTSIGQRRQIAWQTIASVLTDASIYPGQVNSAAPATLSIPSFETWYAKDDFERLFRKLYSDFSSDQRRQRVNFSNQTIEAAEDWSIKQVRSLPSWSAERLAEFAGRVVDPEHANGLAGIGRTRYSAEAARHMLANYRQVKECYENPDRNFSGNQDPSNRTSCFAAEFPEDSAIAKASWRRGDFGLSIPIYDTSATALEKRLANPDFSWDIPDRTAPPESSKMLTMVTSQGAHFHLAALHLSTKRLRDWMWITLWYSDSPNTDFGEDRPDSLNGPDSPWRNYKMCVVVGYEETAPIDGGFASQFPSLAAALTTANEKSNGASWCSNPYLEMGRHNQQTNCIGCHQHAGTSLNPDTMLANETQFPNSGRSKNRETFPADYIWSLNKRPELIGELISERVKFHDLIDGPGPTIGSVSP